MARSDAGRDGEHSDSERGRYRDLVVAMKTIPKTGGTHTVAGVVMEIQLTPGTKAPAEMNPLLPGLSALCDEVDLGASMRDTTAT